MRKHRFNVPLTHRSYRGSQLTDSSERLKKQEIEPVTPGLLVSHVIYFCFRRKKITSLIDEYRVNMGKADILNP